MGNSFEKVIKNFRNCKPRTFSRNEIIVGAGKKQKDSFYITGGLVKVYDLNADGNIKIIAILKKGDMFPLVWGFDHPPDTVYYYKSMGAVTALSIETEELKNQLDENGEFSRQAQLAFVYLAWDLMERIKCLQMPYTQEKILRLLPYLVAKIGGKKSGDVRELNYDITQEEIGQLLGATRESVSAHLAKLENKGVIDRTGRRIKINMSQIPEEYVHEVWFKKA